MNVNLPAQTSKPCVACTPEELARLRAAYAGTGEAHAVVSAAVARAVAALAQGVEFPPRGGQHNQWYQCEKCQLGLKTVDDTHHRCPGCGQVYSGEPYDDVIFSRQHYANLRQMLACAWGYAITGRDDLARRAADVLVGYAERYMQYPYHAADRSGGEWGKIAGGRLFEQTLNESACLADEIAPAFDLLSGWQGLGDAEREAIRSRLILPMLESIDRNKAGKSNWQTWHNAAFVWGGAVLRDPAWIRKAISDPKNGFEQQMRESVSGEGMWYENSWAYHFYTLKALVAIAEGCRRLGIDAWATPALKKMFLLPVRYTMVDGSLPRFGDDPGCSVPAQVDLLEVGWAAYRDPALAALLPASPNWHSVMSGRVAAARDAGGALVAGSEVFAGAGHAILRTTGEAGLSAAFTFGPYGGFHGHFDKLSFVWFGRGREQGVDPGRAVSQAYRLPIHSRWYKATLGHNAVLVDGQSQQPAEGRLEHFAANGRYAGAMAACSQAYPGVNHRRLLLLTPSYVLVFDDLSAEKDRRFDWLYHHRGAETQCEAALRPCELPGALDGSEYVRNARAGESNGTVRVAFDGPGGRTHLTMAGAETTGILTGDGVGASVEDRVPMVAFTRHGRQVRFAAILEPVAGSGGGTVKEVAVVPRNGGAVVTVVHSAATDTVEVPESGQFSVRRGSEVLL